MAEGFTHRFAAPGDATTIAALATQVYLDTYAAEGVRPDLAREVFEVCGVEAFAARVAEPDRRFVLAERGEALLGFAEVMCVPQESPAGGVPGAQLVRLYVQPSAQRAGVGRSLLLQAEQLAARAGLRSLWLTAWEHNARALAFYARMGYADVGASVYTFEDRHYGNRVLAKDVVRQPQ